MNEEKYTLINDYFNGLLDDAQRQNVLDLVATDAEFAEAFHLHEAMEKFPAADARRKQFEANLSAFSTEFFSAAGTPEMTGSAPVKQPVMRVSFARLTALAAAVVVLLVAVWFMFRPQPLSYERYAMHEPLHITTRGAGDAGITAAEQAFNSKNYALALEKITSLRQAKSEDLTLQLYQAMCLIELNRSPEARNLLTPVAAGNSALRSDAVWYVGLSYLRENNLQQCKAVLSAIEPDDFHYQKAKEIMDQIK